MKIFVQKLSILLFIAVFPSFLSGCSGLEKFEKRPLQIETRGKSVLITAEIARTDAQKQQGLMHRKEIKDGEGMIFLYGADTTQSFWMKNTLVPLSIAFIAADGRILEIYDMEPGDLSPVRGNRSYRCALEVPQGWFGRAGIGIGDKVDIKGIGAIN